METTKSQYKTRQHEQLLEYLKSTGGEHFTVEQLHTYFASRGISIGTTTIYRHLEKLIAEGLVNKYFIDENSAACFVYLGESCSCGEDQHYHLKCEKCGKLIHLECDELAVIGEHLQSMHGFTLNPFRTIFYGTCAECGERESSPSDNSAGVSPAKALLSHSCKCTCH